MRKTGYQALAVAVIRFALIEEGWEWLEENKEVAQFYYDISQTTEADYARIYDKLKKNKNFLKKNKKKC